MADASHEMRSPLASSRTVLEVASQHGRSTGALRAAIDDALIDHTRIETLVSDLLVPARLDGSEAAIRRTTVDIAALALNVVARRTESNVELIAPALADRWLQEGGDWLRRGSNAHLPCRSHRHQALTITAPRRTPPASRQPLEAPSNARGTNGVHGPRRPPSGGSPAPRGAGRPTRCR